MAKKNGADGEKTKHEVRPFDVAEIKKVTEIPARGHGKDSVVSKLVKALDGKKGTFAVRAYANPGSASAFARALKEEGLDACARKNPDKSGETVVYVDL